jgi:predicted ArsR family transcriptional regulator
MSVPEIVKMSSEREEIDEISKNQVYHHLPILIESGYIVKYGTVTKGGRTIDYYRRTSKGFVLPKYTTAQDKKLMKKKTTEHIERMIRAFDLGLSEEQVKELIALRLKLFELQVDSRTKIADLVRSDVADDALLDMYEWLVEIHSAGKKEFHDTILEIRKFLFKD